MKIGYAMTASFCTISRSVEILKKLSNKYEIVPILSENLMNINTRFGNAKDIYKQVLDITKKEPILDIKSAEPLGPTEPLDALIILPCTGNTLSKIANGITDTSVTMAAKATLRCDRPIIIGLASNDALSQNLKNIGTLLSRKNVYFIPLHQDDTINKPYSLVCDFNKTEETLLNGIIGKQIEPIIF